MEAKDPTARPPDCCSPDLSVPRGTPTMRLPFHVEVHVMFSRIAVTCSLALLAILGQALPSHAQDAARVPHLDPSVRSVGMGGSSTAVLWGDDMDFWANPALLGAVHGFGYAWSSTPLAPDFAPDI